MHDVRKSYGAYWFAGILMVAAAVRLWAVGHDLPFVYYGDELHKMNLAVGFGSGDLNPHWFHKPALFMYLLFGEYCAYFGLGWAVGFWPDVDTFAVHYFQDPTVFALLARITSALAGIGCVVVVYLIGRRRFGERVGLVAAGLLAFAFPHVRASHFAKADQAAAFLGLLAVLFIFRVAEAGRWRDYLLAGMIIGLGAATKYSPILLALPLYIAHLTWRWRLDAPWWRKLGGARIGAAGAVVLAAFFVGSPYNFLDSHWLRWNLLPLLGFGQDTNVYKAQGLAEGIGVLSRWWRWGRVVCGPEGLGTSVAAAAGLGIVLMAIRHRWQDRIVLACIVAAGFCAALLWRMYESWALNGLYPWLCLAAAVLAVEAVEWAAARLRPLATCSGWAVALAAMALAAPSAIASVRFDHELALPSTRTLACQWVESNLRPGSRIVLDELGPLLSPSPESLTDLLAKAREVARTSPFTHHLVEYYQYRMMAAREPSYEVYQLSHVWWSPDRHSNGIYIPAGMEDADYANPVKVRGAPPLTELVRRGYEYVVISSGRFDSYFEGARGKRFPGVRQFYEDVMSRGKLIHEEAPEPDISRGPRILIYSLPSREP